MTNHGSVGHNVTGHWYLSNSLVDSLLRYRSVNGKGPFLEGCSCNNWKKRVEVDMKTSFGDLASKLLNLPPSIDKLVIDLRHMTHFFFFLH